jgi:hypothetical protein
VAVLKLPDVFEYFDLASLAALLDPPVFNYRVLSA